VAVQLSKKPACWAGCKQVIVLVLVAFVQSGSPLMFVLAEISVVDFA